MKVIEKHVLDCKSLREGTRLQLLKICKWHLKEKANNMCLKHLKKAKNICLKHLKLGQMYIWHMGMLIDLGFK